MHNTKMLKRLRWPLTARLLARRMCGAAGGEDARLVASSLADLARSARTGGVHEIALRASEDLVCNNLMCEQIGGACVCKLARFMDGMARVQRMDVAANRLTVLPDSVWERRTLAHLDASDNLLTTLPPAVAQLGGSLRVLRLARNRLSGLPAELAQLPALAELDLRGNPLTAADGALLAGLAQLRPSLRVLVGDEMNDMNE